MSLNIDKELVHHIANLARININEDEISEYEKNFKSIVEYIDQLKDLDVSDVEAFTNPLVENIHFYQENISNTRKERSDEVSESLKAKEVIKNSPDSKNNEFKIQSVIENS